ncbi:MAG TPA: hypothetical protein VEF33_09320 [Syntrophales bacterium]|nr:hypothetical protein [Syntrophales bacterium]
MRLVKWKSVPGFNWKSIPAWIIAVLGAAWNYIKVWETIEFICKKLGVEDQMTSKITAIVSAPWFPIIILIVGIAWLLWINWLKLVKKSEPTKSESLPSIEILSHRNGSIVHYRETVSGTVNISKSPIRVLIYSGDDMWYRQSDAYYTSDNSWQVECVFGNPDSLPGSPYKIVALSTKHKFPVKIAKLPSGVPKSEQIVVVRSSI